MASDIKIIPGIGGIIDAYDGVILDVWGVLHNGAKPFPGVLDALTRLQKAGKKTIVLSNAPRRAVPVSKRLAEIGVPRELYDHIHTSGEETWTHLKNRDDDFYRSLGPLAYLIAPPRDNDILHGLDIERVEDIERADFILNTGPWGWDEDTARYEAILQAGRRRDLKMVCANPDLVVHLDGREAICAGAIAQRYETIGGTVRWHGKPYPTTYVTTLKLLGVPDRRRILAIGDSLRTDIAGANGAGVDSLIVASGIHNEEFGCPPHMMPDPHRLAKAAETAGVRPVAAMRELRW
jgi:HAD superfamily hydrolase (TIGR01459 family)